MKTSKPYRRHRELTLSHQTSEVIVEKDGVPLFTTGPFLVQSDKRDMVDVVTPNYRSLIGKGAIINNPCLYMEFTTEENPHGAIDSERISPNYTISFRGPVTAHIIDDLSTSFGFSAWEGFPRLELEAGNVASGAKLQALSNMDKTPYAFGEDLGELGKTLRFLKNPITSLVGVSSAFRRAVRARMRGKSGLSLAQAIASVWLTFRFAYRPLVRSAGDAIDAFVFLPKTRPSRLNSRGFSAVSDEEEIPIEHDIGSAQWTFDRSRSESVDYRATILYEVDNPILNKNFGLGLRLKDIPHTMWQLFPYSFMVDRMIDISSFIRAASNLHDPSLRILAGSTTLKNEEIKSIRLTNWVQPGYNVSTSANLRTFRTFTYKRELWHPTSVDTVPSLDLDGLIDTSTKLLDLIALILRKV